MARYSCADCGRQWEGLKECHCASCHESFSTEANFDRHRVFDRDGDWSSRRCLTPAELAALTNRNGTPVLAQSQRKHGFVWVSAGAPPQVETQ